jgi:hypothetical protein
VDQLSERERLRQTFDAVACDYQGARPEYPSALYVRRHRGAVLHVARKRAQ